MLSVSATRQAPTFAICENPTRRRLPCEPLRHPWIEKPKAPIKAARRPRGDRAVAGTCTSKFDFTGREHPLLRTNDRRRDLRANLCSSTLAALRARRRPNDRGLVQALFERVPQEKGRPRSDEQAWDQDGWKRPERIGHGRALDGRELRLLLRASIPGEHQTQLFQPTERGGNADPH